MQVDDMHFVVHIFNQVIGCICLSWFPSWGIWRWLNVGSDCGTCWGIVSELQYMLPVSDVLLTERYLFLLLLFLKKGLNQTLSIIWRFYQIAKWEYGYVVIISEYVVFLRSWTRGHCKYWCPFCCECISLSQSSQFIEIKIKIALSAQGVPAMFNPH